MLTVATWNLENFFRPGAAAGPTSQAAYATKLAHLRATIEAIAPDVLGVQEVGQPEALEDLRAALAGGWHAIASQHSDQRGIRVGFLSRLAFTEHEDIVAFPDALDPIQQSDDGDPEHAMGRGALRVRVSHDATPLDLVCCHLKSKLLSFPGATPGTTSFAPKDEDQRARYAAYALYRRAAEAATVRCRADALLDGRGDQRALVVLGDLNDEAAAATTQMLLGPPGSQIATGGFDHPDAGDGMRLWNLAALIPDGEGYSRIFEGRRELIDHLLVSRRLVGPGNLPGVRVHHQTTGSIGIDPLARRDEPASDHDPVYAHLNI
jgi:endonuclease/exonuclease/phosphatase family metal-dependent hydrolase